MRMILCSSKISLENGLHYLDLARKQKTLQVFSAEDIHNVERIAQGIKESDKPKREKELRNEPSRKSRKPLPAWVGRVP